MSVPKEYKFQIIRDILNESYPMWRGLDAANIPLIEEKCPDDASRQQICDVIETLGRENKLGLNGDWDKAEFARAEAFRDFFYKHDFVPTDASRIALADAHQRRFSGASYAENITVQSLEELLNDPKVKALLIKTDEAKQRERDEKKRQNIAAELIGSLKIRLNPDGHPACDDLGRPVCVDASGRHRVIYANEVERINGLGLDELLRIQAERAENLRLRTMPNRELRETVRTQNPGPQQLELLPAQYTPTAQYIAWYYGDNKDTPPGERNCPAVPWSQELLFKLAEIGTGQNNEVRRLIRRYGADALNEAVRISESKRGK